PDPSRDVAARGAARIAAIEQRLAGLDPGLLDQASQVSHAVLGHLARATRSDLEHGLWEANASAKGYISPQALVFQAVPTALLPDEAAAEGYLRRLRGLAGYFDAMVVRYRQALADGRPSTQIGVRHAIGQLEGYLAKDITADPLAGVALPAAASGNSSSAGVRGEVARVVTDEVRPAMRRLLACLRDEMLPAARPDGQVGIRFVPGGAEGYQAAVRRHTTTGLTAEQIHQIGLNVLADLRAEWAELGGRVLGTTDVPQILARLRDDPALRFTDSAQIVATVSDALDRA